MQDHNYCKQLSSHTTKHNEQIEIECVKEDKTCCRQPKPGLQDHNYCKLLSYHTEMHNEQNEIESVREDETCYRQPSLHTRQDEQVEVKRCNVEYQRKYMEHLRTPEKETELQKYRQKKQEKLAQQKKKEKRDYGSNCDLAKEQERQKNTERQRRFMNGLKSPEKKQELFDYRHKRCPEKRIKSG